MYNISSKKSKAKQITAIVVAIIIFASGMLFVLEKTDVTNLFSSDKRADDTPIAAVVPTAEIKKQPNTVDYGPANPADNQPVTDKKPTDEVTPVPSTELSLAIIRADKSQDKSSLLVKAVVTGSTSGTCTATMSKGSLSKSVTGPVALSASEYSCAGLTFAMSDLLESGTWSLVVTLSDGGGTASSSMEVIL